MSKNTFLWGAGLMLTLLLTAASQPARAESTPVLVVDVTKVVKESIIGKAALHDMEQERTKRLQSLERSKSEVAELQGSLEKQRALLSKSALHEKEDQLIKKKRDLQRAVQDAEADLLKRNQSHVQKVLVEVDAVVKEMAAERKCTFVLDADPRMVLYSKDDVQMTDDVIERLDERKTKL